MGTGNNLKKRWVLIVLCVISIVGILWSVQQRIKKEMKIPAPRQVFTKPRLLAFYEEGWGGIYTGSWAKLQAVKEQVDVISPVWLGLKGDGQVNWDRTNIQATNFFVQNGLEFLVLVTAGSGRNSSSILANRSYRQNALHSMAAYIKRVNPHGICLDFEYINPALKEEFLQFVQELKGILAEKKLFVAVFPYVNWNEPTKEVYDYRNLGEISDGIIIMTYDQHRPTDTPGPIASRGWVEDNLAYLRTQMDARKLWLGIAGYGYQWHTASKKAIALPAWYCRKKAMESGITDTFQIKEGNDLYQYTEKNSVYTIWWEGCQGMREKIAMAAKHHLAGVALWRLGYEEAEFWEEEDTGRGER